MQEWTMSVHSRLEVLIAEYNLERARSGLRPLSGRAMAREMKINHSRLQRLRYEGQPWDLDVLDKLMQFFGLTSFDQLFEYREVEQGEK